jgi:CMP/dCMP kinase
MSRPERPLIIAIDGPSGVGKGTVSRAVARALGYTHVDTGAMYRAVGWAAIQQGLPLTDEPAVSGLASTLRLNVEDGRVVANDTDITRAVRTPDIDKAATAVARMPKVREILVDCQRALARGRGVVMEGRDIGTVVFPAADVKIYLDASPEERARRRAADPAHGGGPQELAAVATALAARDKIDTTRAVSPLMAAPDAVVIDTTDIPVDAVVARVMDVVQKKRDTPIAG